MNAKRHFLLVITALLILGTSRPPLQGQVTGPLDPDTRTSESNEHLKRILERYPQADADRDGILTAPEARAFRSQFEASQKQAAERREQALKNRPKPDHADVSYGSHERNVFDLWLPEGNAPRQPVPVFVFFHGGGFVGGDKASFDPREYLGQGYAAMAANYRFVNGADILAPVPMQDCARALQFLRHKAEAFGIDPGRIALGGGSAGAVIAMWIGYKDDLANPKSEDPVERQSTRVSCIVPTAGPTHLDPDWIRSHLGGPPEIHRSLPLFFGAQDNDYSKPEIRERIRESSVIHHASADDPPTLLIYRGRLDNLPLPEDASQGLLIHHPYFGKVLKEKLDEVGVECEFRYDDSPSQVEIPEFLAKHLGKK